MFSYSGSLGQLHFCCNSQVCWETHALLPLPPKWLKLVLEVPCLPECPWSLAGSYALSQSWLSTTRGSLSLWVAGTHGTCSISLPRTGRRGSWWVLSPMPHPGRAAESYLKANGLLQSCLLSLKWSLVPVVLKERPTWALGLPCRDQPAPSLLML